MSWRTLVVASPSKLDYKMGWMVVRGEQTKRVSLHEIRTVLIENPAVSLTGCLIEQLIKKNVKVIFCDSRRLPAAELIPHRRSHDSTDKIRSQIAWDSTIKGAVHQEIIRDKICKQSEFLSELDFQRESSLLFSYIDQVEFADTTNREGHAAKVYFNALFGLDFTRSSNSVINSALNYGYSLLLSAFSREICLNGYLTQLGISMIISSIILI